MATIQIRNVPEDVYLTYKQRALRARQSLQEYLLAKLIEGAQELTMDEFLDLARENAKGSTVTTADIIEALDAGREERDKWWDK